jgi:hypothetical protein
VPHIVTMSGSGCILQRNGGTFGMYDFTYVRRNGAQDLS